MSSAGSPTTHLNRQYGIIDSLIYDDKLQNTKYWYRGYTTERPRHREYKDLLPTTRDVNYGGAPTIFDVPLYADKLGPVQLCWTQGAITHATGTYWRFGDWLGLAAIDRVVMRFGSNIVNTIYPAKKLWKVMKHLSSEKRVAEQEMLAGLKSRAERDLLAQAAQDIIFDLHFPFTNSPDRYQEIRQLAIPIQIEVYWNRLAQFVETDATDAASAITNLKLKQTNIHVEPQERDANTVNVEQNHGVVRLREDHTLETPFSQRVPLNHTGVFQYEIKNQKSSLRFLSFFVRPTALLNTDFGKTPLVSATNSTALDFSAWYQNIVRFRLVLGSGDVIFDWVDNKFNKLYMNKFYYHGAPSIPWWFYTWDDNPMDENNAHGAYNFQGLQNPILEIDFGATPLAEEMAITTMYSTFNMHQTVRGEVNQQFQ